MEHPGRDPLRGKFTRFLQESIKHFKIDYLRKSERRPVPLDLPWQIQADHHRESSSTLGFDFQWEALGEAYRSLPRSYQEVLFLLLVKELTPQEAASQLRCPVEQVYVRKSRAIKLLRKKLGGTR